jgi:hypothetical protein
VACSQSSIGATAARTFRAALLASALAVTLVAVSATAGPAASATGRHDRSDLTLVSQTDWVTGASMSLHVSLRSPMPRAHLGLKLTVYSRLTSRYAFGLSESGKLAPNELVLDATPIIPVDALHATGSATLAVAMRVRVSTAAATKQSTLGSPGLALDCAPLSCDGVYPLVVTAVNTSNNTPLTSFTTYLVYVAGQSGSTPLRVAVVLPVGAVPALDAEGAPVLTSGQIRSLAATLATIRHDPDTRLTLDLYPQLLVALADSSFPRAAAVLAGLRALARRSDNSGSPEFLEAPFTPVNLDALASAGLVGEFRLQLTRAADVFRSVLSATPPQGVYLSATPLDNASLAELARDQISRVVVPPTGLPSSASMTQTAPLNLTTSPARSSGARRSGISAAVADSALALHFTQGVPASLAAHRFLAEIALVYFEQPFGRQARGIVVAPATMPRSPAFLSDVLQGLESSPVAEQATVTSVFASVPVGADGAIGRADAVPDRASPPHDFDSSLFAARATLNDLESVVPGDATFTSQVADSILLAETAGLGRAAWTHYTAEPLAAFGQVKSAISLAGTRTVTLTQRSSKVPLTIVSAFPSPIHATLMLMSSTLAIAPRFFSLPVVLGHKNTPFEVPVTARTSGVSTLTIALVSPRGGIVLFEHVYTVRSTAFSIVGVALSLAALVVLALWWLRSRHGRRRRRATERAGPEPAVANHG